MLTSVVDALQALPILWFGSDTTPGPRTLSPKAFITELLTLDSKIFAWVHELQTHTSLDDARTKVNRHHDLGPTDVDCCTLLRQCETHLDATFSKVACYRFLSEAPTSRCCTA